MPCYRLSVVVGVFAFVIVYVVVVVSAFVVLSASVILSAFVVALDAGADGSPVRSRRAGTRSEREETALTSPPPRRTPRRT
jgi:hypothetical protein